MAAYLEVWEMFLDRDTQVAQTAGRRDGNAETSALAGTRGGFAEFLLS